MHQSLTEDSHMTGVAEPLLPLNPTSTAPVENHRYHAGNILSITGGTLGLAISLVASPAMLSTNGEHLPSKISDLTPEAITGVLLIPVITYYLGSYAGYHLGAFMTEAAKLKTLRTLHSNLPIDNALAQELTTEHLRNEVRLQHISGYLENINNRNTVLPNTVRQWLTNYHGINNCDYKKITRAQALGLIIGLVISMTVTPPVFYYANPTDFNVTNLTKKTAAWAISMLIGEAAGALIGLAAVKACRQQPQENAGTDSQLHALLKGRPIAQEGPNTALTMMSSSINTVASPGSNLDGLTSTIMPQ